MIGSILNIINLILDRIPSRQESILNRIEDIKSELKNMQLKPGWTANDSSKYYVLTDELQKLEKRSINFGK